MNKRNLIFMTFLLICLSLLLISFYTGSFTNKAGHGESNLSEAFSQATKKQSTELTLKENKLTIRDFILHRDFVAIGDSITAGIGDETKNQGYVGILQDIMNTETQIVNFTNFGKNGNRTDQLLERLDHPEIVEKITTADAVFITIGANDIMEVFRQNFLNLHIDNFNDAQDDYEERLAEVFRVIRKLNPHTTIYLIGFYNPFKSSFPNIDELDYIVESWNELGEFVTQQFDDIHFIPIRDLFGDDTADYLAADNFHLNHAGYKIMAQRILQFIANDQGGIEIQND